MVNEKTITQKPDQRPGFDAMSTYRNAIYGAAALWITLFHGVILDKIHFSLWFINDTLEMGNIGVDIFLLLSGMGLYMSFSRDGNIGRFYYKRLVRVYFPFILIAGPVFAYLFLYREHNVPQFISMITTASYWQGISRIVDLWYVAAALMFYLLYPFIHRFIFFKKKGSFVRFILLLSASVIGAVLIYNFNEDFYLRCDTAIPRLSVFILGCYMGQFLGKKIKFPWWVLVICVLIVAGAYPIYAERGLHGLARRYYGSLCGVALTVLLSQFFAFLSGLKLQNFFGFFGKISLEIYMTTIIVRQWFVKSDYYGGRVFVHYVLAMFAAIAIAYLMSALEKPFTELFMKPLKKNKNH